MSTDEPKSIPRAETLAFAAALLVNLVDQMGPQFTSPVLVTYGQWIGASLAVIANFTCARGLSAMMSNVWMPMLSDRCGRKWVAFLSVLGCGVGYLTQGLAWLARGDSGTDLACNIFMVGRFITGFFSGMQPVLQAYVTELSVPDKTLMTQRLVVMQVASMVGGIVLAPIAGVVATFSIWLPFIVCAGIGVLAMFFVPLFLKEVAEIKGTPNENNEPLADASVASEQDGQIGSIADTDAPPRPPLEHKLDVENASFQQNEIERKRGSPFFDVVIMFMFLAYMCLMVLINSGSVFLLPILLQQPSFGIHDDTKTDEENAAAVALVVGFIGMPLGLCQVAVAILLFVPVTKRFGEIPTLIAAGLSGSCIFPCMGYFADKIWKLVLFNLWAGVSFGFLAPSLGPVAARYGSTIYPKQMALVQGIPLVGLQLSNAFAQIMMAAVVGDEADPHLKSAYVVCGVFCIFFTIFFSLAASIASSRVAAATEGMSEVSREKQGLLVYQAQLQRSPASVGFDFAPLPIANPVMRRAMSVGYAYSKGPVNRRTQSVPSRVAVPVGGGAGS